MPLSAGNFAPLVINSPPRFFYCEPRWTWAPPPLTDFDLWYVVAGLGVMRLADQEIPLHAGVCLVLKPGDTPLAAHRPDQPLVVFATHFGLTAEFGPPDWPALAMVRDQIFFSAVAGRMERLWPAGGEWERQECMRLLRALLGLLWDEARARPDARTEALQELAAAIRREPGRAWRATEMARSLHLSRSQFGRLFQAHFRAAPRDFVIAARVNRAQQLLLETDMTLEAIAHGLGYRDVGFFARQFKAVMGRTPGSVRRRDF